MQNIGFTLFQFYLYLMCNSTTARIYFVLKTRNLCLLPLITHLKKFLRVRFYMGLWNKTRNLICFFKKKFWYIRKSSLSRSQSEVSNINPRFLKNSWRSKNRKIIFLVFDHVIRVIVQELVLSEWQEVSPVFAAYFFQILQPTHFISKFLYQIFFIFSPFLDFQDFFIIDVNFWNLGHRFLWPT